MAEPASGLEAHLSITADDSQATQAMNQAIQQSGRLGEAMTKGGDKAEKALADLAKVTEARAKSIEASEKRITQVTLAESRVRTKELQKEVEEQRRLRSEQTTKQVETKSEGTIKAIEARGDKSVREIEAQRENNRLAALYRADQTAFSETEKRKTAVFKDQLRERRTTFQRDLKRLGPMSQQLQTAISTSIGTSNAAYLLGTQAQAQGLLPSQVWQQQMNRATARGNAANAAALIPPAFGPPARGGGRGGGSNIFTRLLGGGGGGIAGSMAAGLAGGFGIGLGGLAIARGVQGVGEAVTTATAYERQTVAARNLAGSQEKLNELLAAYTVASGGVIDKVTTLSNTTRLMATGFADSVPEIEKFVRATRGASIALGKPQDYVIQETQLAISNVSKKRLDQIGLGIREVDERIKELRKTNAGWTRETAFHNAVMDIMDEKYGKLTNTVEGQATEVEKLAKKWRDLGLAMGQTAKGPVNTLAAGGNLLLDIINGMSEAREQRISTNQRRTDRTNAAEGFLGVNIYDIMGALVGKTGTQIRANAALQSGAYSGRPSSGYIGGPEDFSMRPIGPRDRFNEEQQDIVSSGYKQMLDLERNYGQQRAAETERYESQRLNIIQNFGKMMAREEQDFARQRARGLEDYERSIVEVMRNAQERDAKMREDLADKIAEAREDHEEKIADIQEKYQKDREKAQKDHLDRLMKAAGQLDAIAVLEERKRWKKENEEREEGHKEALKDVKGNLEEQIEDAQKAHDKQLKDAQEADRKRLEDMASARKLQLAREDEDRAIQNARAKEDHDAQLAELDRLHEATMIRLAADYEEQKRLFEEEFAEAMHKAGEYIEGVTEKLLKKQELEEQWFDEMIAKYENLLRIRNEPNPYTYDPVTGPNIPLDYGGRLNETAPLATSSSFSTNSRSLVLGQGSITVFASPGEGPAVADDIENRIVTLLERF